MKIIILVVLALAAVAQAGLIGHGVVHGVAVAPLATSVVHRQDLHAIPVVKTVAVAPVVVGHGIGYGHGIGLGHGIGYGGHGLGLGLGGLGYGHGLGLGLGHGKLL